MLKTSKGYVSLVLLAFVFATVLLVVGWNPAGEALQSGGVKQILGGVFFLGIVTTSAILVNRKRRGQLVH